MENEKFTLRLTAGAFRDIASGGVCTSSTYSVGRFEFSFELKLHEKDNLNVHTSDVEFRLKCDAFISDRSTWKCTLTLNSIESPLEQSLTVGTVIEFSQNAKVWSKVFSKLGNVLEIKESVSIIITFAITDVSERRLILNNFKDTLNDVNNFEYIVGKAKVKLYGNENYLKFHSLELCNSHELPDVDEYEFYDFLELLYDRSPITSKNIDFILNLTQRFKVLRLIHLCESFLLKSIDQDYQDSWFYNVLKWSCVHNLTNLRYKAVKLFKNMEEFADFMKSDQYKAMETKHKLLLSQHVLVELKA